jgi:hypothetical protein
MKTNTINKDYKDNKYTLSNSENYKKDFDCDISKIINTYLQLIIEYSKFIHENIKVKNNSFAKFIVIRGLDTITNVFNYLLYFTKNLDLTYYHCQKSFYFYIEFVGQITEDDKMFLQLTTRDASTYVYKKTIFDINNELKKNNENKTNEFKYKIDIISEYIKIYQTYLLKLIQTNNIQNIEYLVNLVNDLKVFNDISKVIYLEKITDRLYYKINDFEKFFEINNMIVKSLLKHPSTLNKKNDKMNSELFNNKLLEESSEKFVNWLLS